MTPSTLLILAQSITWVRLSSTSERGLGGPSAGKVHDAPTGLDSLLSRQDPQSIGVALRSAVHVYKVWIVLRRVCSYSWNITGRGG